MTLEDTKCLKNTTGNLIYPLISADRNANVIEVKDPHTDVEFLINGARETLELLGYTVTSGD